MLGIIYSFPSAQWKLSRTLQVEEDRLKVIMLYFKFSLESGKDPFSFIII